MSTDWGIDLGALLLQLGENLNREGLQETPERVGRAWSEFLEGYTLDPGEILRTTFEAESFGTQACTNINFFSMCEHHLLPFFGTASIIYQPVEHLCRFVEDAEWMRNKGRSCPLRDDKEEPCGGSYEECCKRGMVAHIGYWPGERGRVAGLSKLTRLVDCFARRLQIQERMTQQIADALMEYLKPVGVLVICKAKHLCCHGRGIRRSQMEFKTTAQCGRVTDNFWRAL